MLLAKPNPQNYYSVTVALFRPNLLIELKRFLFISFFLYSCLLSFLSSYSLFFVCISFYFLVYFLIFGFLLSCFLVVLFSLFPFYLCFSPIFMLVQCRFFMRNVAVDASASCRLYI